MKKLIYAVMLLLGLSIFGSCGKEGNEGNIASTLIGIWTEDFGDGSLDEINLYFEFTKDKQVIFYTLPDGSYANYANGVLITPADSHWEKEETAPYSFVDGMMTIQGQMYGGFITKINNDKLHINWNGEYDWVRIKSFKTK